MLGTDTAETQPLLLSPHVAQPVPEKPLEDHDDFTYSINAFQ